AQGPLVPGPPGLAQPHRGRPDVFRRAKARPADERCHSAGLGAQAPRHRTGKPQTPLAPRSDSIRALGRMSTAEGEDAAILAVASAPKVRRRRLRSILLALMAQYTIVTMIVGLSLAGILRYVVTPQIVAQFEAVEAALQRLP